VRGHRVPVCRRDFLAGEPVVFERSLGRVNTN
jgi:hypothetical protein